MDLFYPQWRNTFLTTMPINSMEPNRQEIKGYDADLVLKEDRPVFRKAYDVPFKLREKVVQHLDSLERQNVISPIQACRQCAQGPAKARETINDLFEIANIDTNIDKEKDEKHF
ncbi:uncharacterized protein LOC134224119 [Armigeres subalbatus]|uniref:uncharacterized protein LOC134224119 n=1 Tax=Armigeres subalbatus TaxID=124917 RepID=UPI002ED68F5A